MNPVHMFDINNYLEDYSPIIDYVTANSQTAPYCAYFTTNKDSIQNASLSYIFANLPTKNSCSSSSRLSQVNMNRIWTCPEFSSQSSCSFYNPDLYKIFTVSLFDVVGVEIVYDLIKLRNKNGHTYIIYNKTQKNITQIYTISYDNDLINEKAIEIFKQHLSESYDFVSSFVPDYAHVDQNFSVSQNQKKNSFLLSLISTE